MLDLARGPTARFRLVTTNFDLIFESVDENLQSWIPPLLPNPESHEDFEGFIHLHGRVEKATAVLMGTGSFYPVRNSVERIYQRHGPLNYTIGS